PFFFMDAPKLTVCRFRCCGNYLTQSQKRAVSGASWIHELSCSQAARSPVSQNLTGGIMAGSTGHASARVRACSAEVKAADRSSILRPSRDRAHKEQLFQPEIAMKDVAFGQPVSALEVKWRKHLAGNDGIGHVGRILGDLLHYTISQQFALLVPVSGAEAIRNKLYEAGQNVLAGGSKGIISVGGNDT